MYGKPLAAILKSVLEFDGDGVCILGEGEPVRGWVVRIWNAEVSRVSSGAQGVAGLPQQHQLYRGVWLALKARGPRQSGIIGVRDVDGLQFGMRAITLDGLGRQGEEIGPAQKTAAWRTNIDVSGIHVFESGLGGKHVANAPQEVSWVFGVFASVEDC